MKFSLEGIHHRIFGVITEWQQENNIDLKLTPQQELELSEYIEKCIDNPKRITYCASCDSFTVSCPDTTNIIRNDARCSVCMNVKEGEKFME